MYNYNIDLNHVVSVGACLNGVFRVTKEAILRHDLTFYKRGLDMLSENKHPDEGYFFERAWKYIFTNYGNCPEEFKYIKNSVWLFGNDIKQDVHKSRRDEAYGHIKFYDDGLISAHNYSLYGHNNEHYWTIKNNFLYILSSDSCITSSYSLPQNIDTVLEIRGDYYKHDTKLENFFFLKQPLWSYYFN